MASNECMPLFTGAEQITVRAEGAIVGKRPIEVNGIRVEGLIDVKPITAGGVPAGIAAYDAADETIVGMWIGLGVYPLIAGTGGVTAAQVLKAEAGGKLIPWATSGCRVGIALDTVAADAEVMVLFRPDLTAV